MRNGTGNLGFDAASGKYVDLVEAGIIDPTKVVRLALENAVSVAGVLLLTEATMTEVPDPKSETASASAVGASSRSGEKKLSSAPPARQPSSRCG